MAEPGGTLQVHAFARGDGSLYYRLDLWSNTRRGMYTQSAVDADVDRLEYRAFVLAGTLAERLNDKYGDSVDPQEAGRMAIEGLRECQTQLRQLGLI